MMIANDYSPNFLPHVERFLEFRRSTKQFITKKSKKKYKLFKNLIFEHFPKSKCPKDGRKRFLAYFLPYIERFDKFPKCTSQLVINKS